MPNYETLLSMANLPIAPVPTGIVVGYARVSTTRQNLERQLDTIAKAGATKVFTDKISGRTMDRPQWEACREYLRPGDTLIVDALDRLGRTSLEVIATVKELSGIPDHPDLKKRGLGVIILDGSGRRLDTRDPIGEALVSIMAVMAQMEVDLTRERAAAAREAAAARGKHTGRPRKLTNSDAVRAHELKAQGLSAGEVGKALGISRASVYRYLSTTETEAIVK